MVILLTAFAAVAFLLLPPNLISLVNAHVLFDWTAHRLEITDIRLFNPEGKQDYHTGEAPIIGAIPVGKPVVINGLVKNQNHTGEHFDYVTQVYGRDGIVEYIYVRYGVAVPFGGQTTTDSSAPLILNDTGLYVVKVFAVIGIDGDSPQLASEPKVSGIGVSQQDRLIIPTAIISQQQAIQIAADDLSQHPILNLTRDCVCAIAPALINEYVQVSEFQSNMAHLPLEFYHVNGTFFEVNATTGVIIGKWDNEHPSLDFQQYNGKFGEFMELGKGRLYWILDGYDQNGVPFLYNVDAVTGEILDSAEIRENIRSNED